MKAKAWINTAMFIETYLFPVIFFYYVFHYLRLLYQQSQNILLSISRAMEGATDIQDALFLAFASRILAGVLLNFLVGWSLLARRNLHRSPERALEVVLPFVGTFFYLSFNFLHDLPQQWNFVLIGEDLILASSLIGVVLALAGVIFSTIAVYNLKNSFGIFVQVRDIVTHGLYKHCRHPIYLGYIIAFSGLFLTNPNLYYLVAVLIFIILELARAVLEERKLAQASEAYRQYQKRTPFLIPFLRRAT